MIKLTENDKIENTSVCIGNFDGVHIAHRTLIDTANEKKGELKSVIYTFSPHPKKVFGKEFISIQTDEEKNEALMNTECDFLFVKAVTKDFLSKSPEDFVREELSERLGAKKVFIGYDFRFGKNSEGNFETLRSLGEKYGFSVYMLPEIEISKVPVKSSLIRKIISEGDFEKAALFLGRPHSYEGEVVHCKGLGKSLGFPTANIFPDENKVLPPFGVYAAKAEIDGIWYGAVVNVGVNPTVENGNQPKMEVNILDFNGDIYGKRIKISFIKIIRKEQKFRNTDELKIQIEKDVKNAKKCLTNY